MSCLKVKQQHINKILIAANNSNVRDALLWYHFISRWFNFRVFRAMISARNLSPATLNNLMVCLNEIKQLREFMPPQIIYL
jgi:hypothetical protein